MTRQQININAIDINNRDLKYFGFSVLLHISVFYALFSVSKPSVYISDILPTASFTLSSESIVSEEVGMLQKPIVNNKKEKIVTSQNHEENDGKSDSNSYSDIIFDHKDLNNPQPQYPLMAKRRGEEGTVLLEVFVESHGGVTKIDIAKSSSYSLLDKAAIEAIKKWQFIPAKRFGQFVSSSVIIPVTFKLKQVNES